MSAFIARDRNISHLKFMRERGGVEPFFPDPGSPRTVLVWPSSPVGKFEQL